MSKSYKAFLVALLFLIFSTSANAQGNRVDQLVKNERTVDGVNAAWGYNLQRISCADSGTEISNITLSLEGGNFGNAQIGILPAGDPVLLNNGGMVQPTYVSDVLAINSLKSDYKFTFYPAVDLFQFCSSPSGYFYLTMKNVGAGGFYRYGSSDPLAYRDLFYGSVSASVDIGPADWYFIVNGVAEVNHPPAFLSLPARAINEGSRISFKPNVTDIDGGNTVVVANNLPAGATFSGGQFEWTPRLDQAGIYLVTFVATDDGNQGLFPALSASTTLQITVVDAHPVITTLAQTINTDVAYYGGPIGVNASWNQNFQRISCADVGSNILNLSFSLEGANAGLVQAGVYGEGNPLFMTNGGSIPPLYTTDTVPVSGTKKDYTFTFPSPIDVSYLCPNPNGYFFLTMRNVDGGVLRYGSNNPAAYRDSFYGSASASVNIGPADWYFVINKNINSAPHLMTQATTTIAEGQPLSFSISATDPDNDPLILSASGLPTGASFNPTTGLFTWTPSYTAAGTYQVTFSATENTPAALSDSKVVTIIVTNTNRPPTITPISNKTVNEGQILTFPVAATDPDGDIITLSAANLPAGASFNPTTGLFAWTPSYSAAGNYPNIEFTATDNGSPIALDVIQMTVTVGDINRLPDITNPGPQEVLEGHPLTFVVSATDPDGDGIVLSASGMPTGALFNSTTGTFTWTPSLTAAGTYTVTLTATDNGAPAATRSTDVVITVGDSPTPVEQAQSLVTSVVAYNLPTSVQNSYLANLQKVEPFITDGKVTPAINQLNAFLAKILKDYQKGIITQVQYNSMRTAATKLIADLTN